MPTNVVVPELCVITSIGMDHTDLLGDTLELIAAEKAGILKPGVPVVLGCLPPEAERVIVARAAELGCPVHRVLDRFGRDRNDYPTCRLSGENQRLNAATAVLALETLGPRFVISAEALRQGLNSVVWAGRWDERQICGRRLILDSTHNEEGLPLSEKPAGGADRADGRTPDRGDRHPGVNVGLRTLLPAIADFAPEIVLLRPKQPRACSWESMEAAIPAGFSGIVRRGVLEDLFPGGEPHLNRESVWSRGCGHRINLSDR